MATNKEEEKILKITVRYDDALEGIKKYKKEIQELKEAEKELTKESEDYDEELELINAKRKEAEASIRVLRKEIQNNIKIEKQQEGSLKQLRAALSNATKEYDEMSKAERESAKGVELKNHINDITKELKGAEEETQRFYRNVGNYKNSILEAIGVNGGFADSLMSMAENGKGVKGFFTAAISNVKAFGTALLGLLANPVFLAIAGIAGAGMAFKWWYDYNKGVAEATRLTKIYFDNLELSKIKEYRNEIQAIADFYNKDYREVLEAVNVLVKQFGIDGREAIDIVREGFLAGADVNGQYLEIIAEYSTQFKKAGLSASEFVAFISDASTMGIFGDKAFDAVKEATLRITEMDTATREAITGLGLNVDEITQGLESGTLTVYDVIKKVSDKMNELPATSQVVATAVTDIFGGAGEDAGNEYLGLLGQIATKMEDVSTAADEVTEAERRIIDSEVELENALSDLFDNTGGAFETMGADIEVFFNRWWAGVLNTLSYIRDFITWNDKMQERFGRFLQNLAGVWQSVTKFFQELANLAPAIAGSVNNVDKLNNSWKNVSSTLSDVWSKLKNIFNSKQEGKKLTGYGNWMHGIIKDNTKATDAEGIQKEIDKLNNLKNSLNLTSTAYKHLTEAITERTEALKKANLQKLNTEEEEEDGDEDGGGNKPLIEKEIKQEYQTRQDQIEKEAELIRKRLELVKYEGEERYRIKMELLEKEKQLEIMRITEEYTNEVQRNEALRLLDLEYSQKAQEIEKEKSDVLLNEVIARSQAMMDAVTKQKEHEKRTAEEEKRIQETKANAIVKITGALSDVLANASDNNEALAKVAKGLAIAEILISQGVAIAKAVEAATKSGGTWWTVAATIATAVATVTATMSSAMKSVNSAKVGGGGSAGGSGGSSMTYTSSAMFNPMLAQLNSVGDNMMPYESRMRDEGMNEEMMTDAVTRGVQNQPAPVVSVVEITETQNRVRAIESMGDV